VSDIFNSFQTLVLPQRPCAAFKRLAAVLLFIVPLLKVFVKAKTSKNQKNNSKKSQITLAPDSWTGRMGMKSGMTQGDWHEAF
jgi:hypothetical protein